MVIESTSIKGVFILNNFNAHDERGLFVKTFNNKHFRENKIDFKIMESYYSISKRNVIRGMHFQLPPHDHEKLVYVTHGEIIDVVLDLRKKSDTYKRCISINLSVENKKSLFIPKGLAHGFKSLKDDTITVYNVGSEYNSKSDSGIKYDSFNYDWNIENPIVSERDIGFNTLNYFSKKNPF